MKFYVSIVVHQNDSTQPDYQLLHSLLTEAGFLQRGLDGTLTQRPTSGLYQREDSVLSRSDIEFDLQVVFGSFPHRCSFELEHVSNTSNAIQAVVSPSLNRFAEITRTHQNAGTLIH